MEELWTYLYRAKYFDNNEEHKDSGIVIGCKFSDAFKRLEDWYGDDCLLSIEIECFDNECSDTNGIFTVDALTDAIKQLGGLESGEEGIT